MIRSLFNLYSKVLNLTVHKVWRWHSGRSRKFISATKEMRLFHLRKLLISLNICSDRTEKLRNMIRTIYYIVLSKIRKN